MARALALRPLAPADIKKDDGRTIEAGQAFEADDRVVDRLVRCDAALRLPGQPAAKPTQRTKAAE